MKIRWKKIHARRWRWRWWWWCERRIQPTKWYISSLLTRHFVASGNNSHATHAMSYQHYIQFTNTHTRAHTHIVSENTRGTERSDNKINVVVLKLQTSVRCPCEIERLTLLSFAKESTDHWPHTLSLATDGSNYVTMMTCFCAANPWKSLGSFYKNGSCNVRVCACVCSTTSHDHDTIQHNLHRHVADCQVIQMWNHTHMKNTHALTAHQPALTTEICNIKIFFTTSAQTSHSLIKFGRTFVMLLYSDTILSFNIWCSHAFEWDRRTIQVRRRFNNSFHAFFAFIHLRKHNHSPVFVRRKGTFSLESTE